MDIESKVRINTNDFYKGKIGTVKKITDKAIYNIGVILDEVNMGIIVWFTESELKLTEAYNNKL